MTTQPERPDRDEPAAPDSREKPEPESEEDLQTKDASEMPLAPQNPVMPSSDQAT